MTIIAAAIILSFTSIEFFDYRRVNVDTSIVVDRSRGEKLTANMNITFPRVPCYCECRIFLNLLPLFVAIFLASGMRVQDVSRAFIHIMTTYTPSKRHDDTC